jgi:hypothetical protein
MTTQPTPATARSFFQTPTASTASASEPGYLSSFFGGVGSLLFAPVRYGTAEATQGAADRVSGLFNTHQSEITERVRAIFTTALLRRTPDNYHRLLHHIQAFLRNPSKVDLDQINPLLDTLTAEQIRVLAPQITNEGIGALTSLKNSLQGGVNALPAFTVSADTMNKLKDAETILKTLIENHEGVMLQTLNTLTQGINANDGPLNALRSQLNHPESGILAQSLGQLRSQLTSRASPELRQAKQKLDEYRATLTRNEHPTGLNALHSAIAQLLGTKTLVPQIQNQDWQQIAEFQGRLQTLISNTGPRPNPPELLEASKATHQLLTEAFNVQRGVVEEAADILVEGIGRGVEQLIPMPRRMLEEVFSSRPAAPSAQTNGQSSSAATLNIGTIHSQGSTLLNAILGSAGSAFSNQALQSLATLLCHTFEKIYAHIERDAAHQQLLSTIRPMIERLQSAMTNNSWAELAGTLQDAFRFIQEQQVYLQGLRLPINPIRTHFSAIPAFLSNINAHRNALHSPVNQSPQRVTVDMIKRQGDCLNMRASSYGVARFIAETLCGLTGSPAFYAAIYRPASDGIDTHLSPLFRQRLFEKIDGAPVSVFTKWIAKRAYDLCLPLSTFYISSITNAVLEATVKWVKTPSSSEGSKEELLIKLVRNWMAVTGGAYNQVAHTPASQSRDFQVMMEEALKTPERNGGLTQQELFAAVGRTMLDTFGPRIRWSEAIENHLTAQIPESSPLHFLNPLVKELNLFCGLCLKTITFIPQWIGNQVLQAGAKLALGHTPLLLEQSENAIESLRRNTPTSYAMHRLIFQKQQKILTLLQQSLQSQREGGSELAFRNSNIKKMELRSLVEHSLEILNKSQYSTQDRLRNYLNQRASLRDRARHELEDTFLPELMETIVSTLSTAMQTMAEEDEMLQMLHSSLGIANNAFDVSEPVPEAEFAAVEKGIRDMTDQILETTLFHAIGEKFDFTNAKQKQGVSQFMSALKAETQRFSATLSPLAAPIGHSEPLTASDLKHKITAMIDASSLYNSERVKALGIADGNPHLHTETKHHLNELSRQLLTRSTPLSDRLNTMKSESDDMLFCDQLLQPLLMSRHSGCSLVENLQNRRTSLEDFASCKHLLLALGRHLEKLHLNRCPQDLLDTIQCHQRESLASIETIETLQTTERLLQQTHVLFLQLRQKKIAEMNTPPSSELRELEQQLNTLLNALPSLDAQARLKELSSSLMQATQTDSALSTAARFSSACIDIGASNLTAINRNLEMLKQSQSPFQNRLSQSIREYTQLYTRNQTSIQAHARELVTEAGNLNTWTQNQNEQPIWNLFAFDMQWVTEITKTLSFDSARTKIQQLFTALYQRHNYIGFTNQVVLLPFLKHFGAHHLKP